MVRGQKAPIVGRVCMDQMMVDVTDIKNVTRADIVTLIGKDGDAEITVEEIAALAGTFNYEFVCDLGKRIPRSYYLNGEYIGTLFPRKLEFEKFIKNEYTPASWKY